MKRIVLRFGSFVVLAVFAATSLIVLAGCKNDEAPPDDPSYYKGPMKPKGAGAGTQTDSAVNP